MSAPAIRRAVGVLAAAQRSYSGCLQYKENVRDARAALARQRAGGDVDVTYVARLARASRASSTPTRITCARRCAQLPADVRATPRGSSSPRTASRSRWPSAIRYEEQLRASARAGRGGRRPRATGRSSIQSRSGRPEDPWLEPDVCDYLRREHAGGPRARPCSARSDSSAITSRCCTTSTSRRPRSAAKIGLPMARAEAVNVASPLHRRPGGRRAGRPATAIEPVAIRCRSVGMRSRSFVQAETEPFSSKIGHAPMRPSSVCAVALVDRPARSAGQVADPAADSGGSRRSPATCR